MALMVDNGNVHPSYRMQCTNHTNHNVFMNG